MPADETPDIFGPEGDHTATETLPFHIPSGKYIHSLTTPRAGSPDFPIFHGTGDGGCSATIDTPGRAYDVASFYDIWIALSAIFAICSRKNQGGVIRGLGTAANSFLQKVEIPLTDVVA